MFQCVRCACMECLLVDLHVWCYLMRSGLAALLLLHKIGSAAIPASRQVVLRQG